MRAFAVKRRKSFKSTSHFIVLSRTDVGLQKAFLLPMAILGMVTLKGHPLITAIVAQK